MPCVSLVFYVIVDFLPTVLLFPSPLFLLPPPQRGRLCGRLCRTTPLDRVENRSFLFFFARASFFLGLIAQPREEGSF